jgi:hypothetical protein
MRKLRSSLAKNCTEQTQSITGSVPWWQTRRRPAALYVSRIPTKKRPKVLSRIACWCASRWHQRQYLCTCTTRAALAKKNSAGNFPQINHSRKNEIFSARIVWRSIFFVLVSHAATKKTDCTNQGAMLLITAIVGFAT